MNSQNLILRDAIEMAKEAGLWQLFTMNEKKSLVAFFKKNILSRMKLILWEGNDGNGLDSRPRDRFA